MSFFEDNKRTHDTEFTAEENEALLRAYSQRRQLIEGTHETGLTLAGRKAVWEEISASVNAVGGNNRSIDKTKKRYKNMFADYKKWRGQTENSPMEDGRMMPYKPFFSLFEEFLSDDPRVHEIAKRRSTTEIKATPILKKHLDYTPGLPRKLHGDTTSIASTSSNCSKSDTELLRLECLKLQRKALEKQILASEAQTIAAKIQAAAADKQLEYFTEAIKHIGKKKSFDDDEPFGRFIP